MSKNEKETTPRPRPKRRKTGGRKTKLNEQTERVILAALRRGASNGEACAASGVSEGTFYRWLNQGESAKSGIYRQFYENVSRAKGVGNVELLNAIHDAALRGKRTVIRKPDGTVVETQEPGDWRAAQAALRYRDPERFAVDRKLRIQQELTGKGGGPVEQVVRIDFANATEEDLEKLAGWSDEEPVSAGNGERDD